MKMMKRLMALLMALLLCGACALAEMEAVQSPDDVMATVNGEAITRAEFEQYYTILCNQYADLGYDVTLPENDVILRDWALDNAVQVTLMDQKIAEIGMALTEEEKAAAAKASAGGPAAAEVESAEHALSAAATGSVGLVDPSSPAGQPGGERVGK